MPWNPERRMIPRYLHSYWRDVHDAGWQFRDLIWAGVCSGLALSLGTYTVCWMCGACG